MKDYIADRRQYGTSGKRIGGGWLIMRWDEERQIYIEGMNYHLTKGAAQETLQEEKNRAVEESAAARILGRKGGQARSDAKTTAARENAKKGGWPKGRPRKNLK